MRMIKWLTGHITDPSYDAQMQRLQDEQDRLALEHVDELESIYREIRAVRRELDDERPTPTLAHHRAVLQ